MKYDEIKSITDLLIGLPCWSVIAGKGTGSVISLGFGGRQLRSKPLNNKNLTDDERKYHSDISLMIHCSWRLSSKNEILSSWREALENRELMLTNLKSIRNKKINNIDIDPISLDLKIYFEGNKKLDVFCDETDDSDADDNYNLFTNEKIINVGLKSILSYE